eukprot:CCRYP_005134-RA/>CCRYP_005134-RA protein AED:0.17 eAED:0.17 QI:701/1/1/1/1/1/3/383/699
MGTVSSNPTESDDTQPGNKSSRRDSTNPENATARRKKSKDDTMSTSRRSSSSAAASSKQHRSRSSGRRKSPPNPRSSSSSAHKPDEHREDHILPKESSSSSGRKRHGVTNNSSSNNNHNSHRAPSPATTSSSSRRQSTLVMGGKPHPPPPSNHRNNHHHNSSSSRPSTRSSNTNTLDQDHSTNDLPMADLMAYLQIVADNSSNLPLTRRDDPELGRTVSSLTGEEYETKCRAFVPANVRIFGGMFGRYGRVWDLPTSEEFDIIANTREPGLSHGGAVCNALLKAMYDTESETTQVAQTGAGPASPATLDPKNLFDDDDDETVDTAGFTVDRTVASFDTLLLNDNQLASTLSWAELLRKMNIEMQGVGYNQFAAITSSYKLDLTAPFSLIPPDFKQGHNKKRALLIGCNYRRTPDAGLKACHDDVRSIKDFLVNVYGFPESPEYMTVLMDDNVHRHPTFANITEAFKKLAQESQPGDALFVLFSGHGCRVLDSPIDSEAESYDEALIPCDYNESGIIRDTLVFKTLLAPMRKGVTMTCILDSCHTGVMVDLPYLWSTKGEKGEVAPKMTLNNDFSFVRFLKVVKTLYESSVFTKLGKGIGSELSKQLPARDDETATETTGSLVTMPENEAAPKLGNHQSIFHMLTCQSPKDLASKVINCTLHTPADSDDETLPQNNTMEDFDDQTHDTYSTATSGEGGGR